MVNINYRHPDLDDRDLHAVFDPFPILCAPDVDDYEERERKREERRRKHREYMREYNRKYKQKPEVKAKRRAYAQRPEVKERNRIKYHERYHNSEFGDRERARFRERYARTKEVATA